MALKDGKCFEPGCDNGYYGKGLCKTHYMRKYRASFVAVAPEIRLQQVWEGVVKELGISGANERRVKI